MEPNRSVIELIRDGNTLEAIEVLGELTKDQNKESLIKELVILSGRYNALERDKVEGLINMKNYLVIINKLNSSILDLYLKLEKGNAEYNHTDSTINLISLWSVEGELINSFGNSKEDVKRVVFAPDGLSFLACSSKVSDSNVGKSNAKLWSTEGELLLTYSPDNGGVSDASFSPDGKSVLTGGHYGLITQWSVAGEKLSETRSGTERINSVAFGPDNRVHLVGREDEVAELLSTTGEEPKSFLSSNNLARIGPFGKLAGQPFINIFPERARLLSLEVRSGDQVDQLKLSYRLGKEEQEFVQGGDGGKAWPKFWINSPITKITGRAGDQLDQLQVHFEDGTSTPVYGGEGGQPFSVSFAEYELAGFFGQAGNVVCQLGFFGKASAQRSY